MRTEVKDLNRINLFELFNSETNPFLILTTKIDITNLYKKGKPYYPLITYFITLAVNKVDNFKYRYEDGKIYFYNNLTPEFTDRFKDNNIGFFACKNKNTYKEFLEEYNNKRTIFLSKEENILNDNQGEIWVSCAPWYKIESLLPPFNKSVTVPQFIWDKFSIEEDKCYINLTIMVHHGFVDAYHIHLFLSEFNKLIENIDEYL